LISKKENFEFSERQKFQGVRAPRNPPHPISSPFFFHKPSINARQGGKIFFEMLDALDDCSDIEALTLKDTIVPSTAMHGDSPSPSDPSARSERSWKSTTDASATIGQNSAGVQDITAMLDQRYGAVSGYRLGGGGGFQAISTASVKHRSRSRLSVSADCVSRGDSNSVVDDGDILDDLLFFDQQEDELLMSGSAPLHCPSGGDRPERRGNSYSARFFIRSKVSVFLRHPWGAYILFL
jgi:hypothetical protein